MPKISEQNNVWEKNKKRKIGRHVHRKQLINSLKWYIQIFVPRQFL